ncbi:MAG: hypothetical protein RR891_06260 [Clostridium sp.]
MSIFKEIIESITKIDYAIKMQEKGMNEYLSMEMGHRDFISSCWYHIGEGILEGYNEANLEFYNQIKLPSLTDEQVRIKTKKIIVRGCYKEGADKEFLKDAFDLDDNELNAIIALTIE